MNECARVVAKEKEKAWKDFVGNLTMDAEANKKMYSIIIIIRNKRRPAQLAARTQAADGKLLEKPEEISVAWREYFETLLDGNGKGEDKEDITGG